jgi:hypothetical protein
VFGRWEVQQAHQRDRDEARIKPAELAGDTQTTYERSIDGLKLSLVANAARPAVRWQMHTTQGILQWSLYRKTLSLEYHTDAAWDGPAASQKDFLALRIESQTDCFPLIQFHEAMTQIFSDGKTCKRIAEASFVQNIE